MPFTLGEAGNGIDSPVDDIVPDRIYSKQELLTCLQSSREKCKALIFGLTEEKLQEQWVEVEGGRRYPVL